MIPEPERGSLLRALNELYIRISQLDLLKRISAYHKQSSNNQIKDISGSMNSRIEALVAESNKHGVAPTPMLDQDQLKSSASDENHKSEAPASGVMKLLDGLARYYKTSASRKVSDQYMGEKLRTSIWSHIHTAFMQARHGDVSAAKLHADIANQALQQAAHYMNDEDYRALCEEVEQALGKIH